MEELCRHTDHMVSALTKQVRGIHRSGKTAVLRAGMVDRHHPSVGLCSSKSPLEAIETSVALRVSIALGRDGKAGPGAVQ